MVKWREIMYSQKVIALLDNITIEDYQYIMPQFAKKIAQAGEHYQQVQIYYVHRNYYFKAIGSPYLLIMANWLINKIETEDTKFFKEIDIAYMYNTFDLPIHKRKDALLILQLIEQLYG